MSLTHRLTAWWGGSWTLAWPRSHRRSRSRAARARG